MHVQGLVGLLLLGLMRRIDADLATGSTPLVSDFDTANETSTSATKFLRTSGVNDDDEGDDTEERVGLSAVDKLKNLFSSSTVSSQQLETWLDKGKSADTVFARMHLTDAGEGLLFRPQFTEWLKYAEKLSAKNPTKETSAISTLTTHYGDTGLYKMLDAGAKNWKTEDLAAKLQTQQVQHWITTAKDPDDVFRIMTLDKVKKDILSNPEFSAWAKYVDNFNAKYPEQPTSMISTLLNYYSDAGLFKLTETATNVKETKSIATKLHEQLVHVWLKSRKTPDDALVDLGLGVKNTVYEKPLDTLLEKPLFNSWAKYLDTYNAKYPQTTTMIETLTRRFGDEDVVRMLIKAKTKDVTRNIATNLESAQLELWLSSGKSADDVFKLLKLDLPGVIFEKNPLVSTWISYMNVFVKKNPSKIFTLLSTLESRFKDRRLNQIFLVAKKYPSMESGVAELQTKMIQSYLTSNESPKKVFNMLALDNVGDTILGDPLFKMWMNYVQNFNKKNPKQRESWFWPLSIEYHWYGIERMIKTGMQNPSTVNVAKLVKKQWLKSWLDQERPPKDAFQFLYLHKMGETTLASPTFKTWAKYLGDFNHRYPTQRETMLDVLRANYYDRGLLMMLNTAKKDPSTEKLASNLQNALINKWLAEKKKPVDLKRSLSDVPTADKLIARYIKKLDAVSGNAS